MFRPEERRREERREKTDNNSQHTYDPASAGKASSITRFAAVAVAIPRTGSPLRFHWYVKSDASPPVTVA